MVSQAAYKADLTNKKDRSLYGTVRWILGRPSNNAHELAEGINSTQQLSIGLSSIFLENGFIKSTHLSPSSSAFLLQIK